MQIRILVADDHQVVRQGLHALLERAGFEVVGEAGDGWQAVRLAKETSPDVVILDVVMPALNGLDAARQILEGSPKTAIVLLTAHPSEPYILDALRMGIRGFVVKTEAVDDLVQAIHDVLQGQVFLGGDTPKAFVEAYLASGGQADDPLTARERQVLQLVAEGNTTKEIARMLEVSFSTAQAHRHRIMKKLGIHDAAGLVRYAIRRGLVKP